MKAFFPEFDLYSSLFIAYIGIIFAGLYCLEGSKGERLLAAFLFTFFGAILAFHNIYKDGSVVNYPTLFAVMALIPAMTLAPAVFFQGKTPDSMKHFANIYSLMACVIAIFIIGVKLLKTLDFSFAIFILP